MPNKYGELYDWEYPAQVKKLYKLQEENLPKLRELISKEGGKIHAEYRDGDGWGDGFKVTYFIVEFNDIPEDLKCCGPKFGTDRIIKLRANDRGNALYYHCDGGGWGLYKSLSFGAYSSERFEIAKGSGTIED